MNEKYTKRTTIEGTEESEYFTGCLILLRSRTSFPLPARRTLTNCSHLGQLARSLAFSHHFSLLVLHRFGSGWHSSQRNEKQDRKCAEFSRNKRAPSARTDRFLGRCAHAARPVGKKENVSDNSDSLTMFFRERYGCISTYKLPNDTTPLKLLSAKG